MTSSQQENFKLSTDITAYHFLQNQPMTEDSKEAFCSIHERLEGLCQKALKELLNKEVQVEWLGVEQLPFSSFFACIEKPVCLATFDISPVAGTGIILMDTTLAYSAIHLLLGGNGRLVAVKPLSSLHMALNRKLFKLVLAQLTEAWQEQPQLNFTIDQLMETDTIESVFTKQTPCLFSQYRVTLPFSVGLLTVAFPLYLFQGKLLTEPSLPKKPSSFPTISWENIQTEIKATLGSLSLPQKNLTDLKVGDILDFHNPTSEGITISIGNVPICKAQPGLLGKKKAFKISTFVDPNSDHL